MKERIYYVKFYRGNESVFKFRYYGKNFEFFSAEEFKNFRKIIINKARQLNCDFYRIFVKIGENGFIEILL